MNGNNFLCNQHLVKESPYSMGLYSRGLLTEKILPLQLRGLFLEFYGNHNNNKDLILVVNGTVVAK